MTTQQRQYAFEAITAHTAELAVESWKKLIGVSKKADWADIYERMGERLEAENQIDKAIKFYEEAFRCACTYDSCWAVNKIQDMACKIASQKGIGVKEVLQELVH